MPAFTRLRRYRSASLLVFLGVILAFGSGSANASSRTIPLATIAGYASQIAGQPITINCVPDATMAGDDGFTQYGATMTILPILTVKQSVCAEVEAINKQPRYPTSFITYGGKRADVDGGSGLEVIEHELMHVMLQSSDEGLVDCSVYQNRWAFVKLFRFPSWIANVEMAGMAWNHDRSDPQYRTVC